jgi:hypothetical protein
MVGRVVAHLEDVPDDVLGNILGRLDLVDILALERVSRLLHDRVRRLSEERLD